VTGGARGESVRAVSKSEKESETRPRRRGGRQSQSRIRSWLRAVQSENGGPGIIKLSLIKGPFGSRAKKNGAAPFHFLRTE
jgi:hypothetical protein